MKQRGQGEALVGGRQASLRRPHGARARRMIQPGVLCEWEEEVVDTAEILAARGAGLRGGGVRRFSNSISG
eukprot:COSAG01_NODE_3265_length_6333_cov_16.099775_3_plen_71_part_00